MKSEARITAEDIYAYIIEKFNLNIKANERAEIIRELMFLIENTQD
jgi:hypothetical protein